MSFRDPFQELSAFHTLRLVLVVFIIARCGARAIPGLIDRPQIPVVAASLIRLHRHEKKMKEPPERLYEEGPSDEEPELARSRKNWHLVPLDYIMSRKSSSCH